MMDKPHELLIEARRRTVTSDRASLTDFEVTPGASVDLQWLVQNPRISLYSLEAATSQAIFVALAPEVDLTAVPFVWNAHYEGAQRLFAASYSDLVKIGEGLKTKLDHLILLFNIGRCGSTLLHHIFNRVPGVVSLSEPEGFIPYRNEATRLPEGETTAILQASAKFLFRPQVFPDLKTAVIKFRGRDMRLMQQCQAAFPDATKLFLYRDATGYVASWMRVEQQLGRGSDQAKIPLENVIAWIDNNFEPVSLHEIGLGNFSGSISAVQRFTLLWMVAMDYHRKQVQRGMPVTAWRYADLNQRRQETLKQLFAVCDLPLDAVPSALAEFERDSQKGTVMAREEGSQGNTRRLNAEEEEEIRALVACHPLLQTTNYVAPGTVLIEDS